MKRKSFIQIILSSVCAIFLTKSKASENTERKVRKVFIKGSGNGEMKLYPDPSYWEDVGSGVNRIYFHRCSRDQSQETGYLDADCHESFRKLLAESAAKYFNH